MDLMPRAGTASPPSPDGDGGEAGPESVTPPSQTFGFPFVPLRGWRRPDMSAWYASLSHLGDLVPTPGPSTAHGTATTTVRTACRRLDRPVGTDAGNGFGCSEELDR